MKTIITMNKGFGAGGANTNKIGLTFERKTDNGPRLMVNGYQSGPCDSLFKKEVDDKTVSFVTQHHFRQFMQHHFSDLQQHPVFRNPDEAYIIEQKSKKPVIKILEKKAQTVMGSVETKLWAAPSLKREYELVLGDSFEVHYALCISTFLGELFTTSFKFQILKKILDEQNIQVFFGDQEDYFSKLDAWLE
jgi:hypothetical protein